MLGNVTFLHFFISFKHDFHVDAENMIVRTPGMSIISVNIFEFPAQRFLQQTAKNGLLPLWGSVDVLCLVVRNFVSSLVLQSSCLGGKRWLLW